MSQSEQRPMRQHATWHQGSIYRYASLWHTLHRYAVLNVPSKIDFAREILGSRSPSEYDLFRDEAPHKRISVVKVAATLSEANPTEISRLWTVSAASEWAYELFCRELVMCLECVSAGYHSVLMSMRFLDSCPVHGTPLAHRCTCGARFDSDLRALVASPGRCEKCGFCFVDRNLARRPHLNLQQLEPWLRVGEWVEAMNRWVRGRERVKCNSSPHLEVLRQHAHKWSKMLAVSIPHFLEVTESAALQRYVETSVRSGPRATLVSVPARGGSEGRCEAMGVYWALKRRIRTRVLSRADRRSIQAIRASSDADYIARRIGGSAGARLAFATVLWEMHVERKNDLRKPGHRRDSLWWDVHESTWTRLRTERGNWRRQDILPFKDWVEMHAASTALTTLWLAILDEVTKMAQSGLAAWDGNFLDVGSRFFWGIGTFDIGWGTNPKDAVNYLDIRPCGDVAWRTVKRERKADRQLCNLAKAEGRWRGLHNEVPDLGRRVLSDPNGTCGDCGFGTGIKRHRLFGIPGRPHFLVGRIDNEWVARLDGGNAFGRGAKPSSAIDALRAKIRIDEAAPGLSAYESG